MFSPTKINGPLLLLRMLMRELVKVVRLLLGVPMLQDVVQVGQPVLEGRLERVVLGQDPVLLFRKRTKTKMSKWSDFCLRPLVDANKGEKESEVRPRECE